MTDTPITDSYRLTRRERDVLALLITAAPDAEIAQKLEITVTRVRNIVNHLMKKTRTSSRLDLAMLTVHRRPELGAEIEKWEQQGSETRDQRSEGPDGELI
jgi:DNA-binding CsgD family transcriptional regulator